MIRTPGAARRLLAAVGVLDGVVLGIGLETCFGVDRYTAILLLGATGGGLIGLMTWIVRKTLDRHDGGTREAWRLAGWAAGPALAAFVTWFVWRVVPLIREELTYTLP